MERAAPEAGVRGVPAPRSRERRDRPRAHRPRGAELHPHRAPLGARAFCQGLRDWDPDLFNNTDFKLTDGVPAETKFKALTLKSTQELVAYGLGGERAPLLNQNTAKHLEADEYPQDARREGHRRD